MLYRYLFVLYVVFVQSAVAHAELEAGFGLSVINVPHYVGSDEAEQFVLPFPYLRYRSEKITIDRNLIQGNLWQSGNWSLEISLGGAVKVDSDKSQARKDMDDLDFIIEAGPALHYYFLGDRSKGNAMFLELPIRFANSTDFTQASYRGITFNPRVVWRREYLLNGYEIRPQISLGLRSASSHYHDYIYGVDSRFVTRERNGYKGDKGYGGWQAGYSTAVLWSDWIAAGFMRYVGISGAAFEDSPLVKTRSSFIAGMALAYLF
jgi:outer membrane scaffolding protein for murein synthesis (MipA/OmpV family)